jgi:hypothetical protein
MCHYSESQKSVLLTNKVCVNHEHFPTDGNADLRIVMLVFLVAQDIESVSATLVGNSDVRFQGIWNAATSAESTQGFLNSRFPYPWVRAAIRGQTIWLRLSRAEISV